MKKLNLLFTLLYVLALQQQASAQWQFFARPERHFAQPVAIDEQSFFISGINHPLLISKDGGQTFQEITEGLPENGGVSPYLDLSPEYTLATVSSYYTLYRLLPDAQAWEPFGAPIPGHSFDKVQRVAGKLLALTYETIADEVKIFQSIDEGNTWTLSVTGLPADYNGWSFSAFDSVAVVTHGNGGVYFSTDGGDNWQPAAGGEGAYWFVNRSRWLIFASHTPGGFDGLSFSADGGKSWQVPAGLPTIWGVTSLASSGGKFFTLLDPFEPEAPAFYSSTDQGSTWQPVGSLNVTAEEVGDLVATENGTLLLFAHQRLYASFDTGASWTIMMEAPDLEQPKLITAGQHTYLMGDSGFFASADDGLTWENMTESLPMGGYHVRRIFVNDSLILGADIKNISRSPDGGQTWTKQSVEFVQHFLQTPEGIYAAASNSDHVLYKSTDMGITWSPVPGAPVTGGLYYLLQVGNKLFAGGTNQRVFVSDDDGETWSESSAGIPFHQNGARYVVGLAHDPSTGKIYAGIFNGELYESTNMGQSWTQVGNFYCRSIAAQDSSVYVSGNNQVYFTHDDGANWDSSTHPDMGSPSAVSTVLFGNNVLVGTNNGAFLSTDNGESWEKYNEGLSQLYPLSLVQDEEFVYGAFGSYGIYRHALNEFPTLQNEPHSLPFQIFPNPSADGIFYLQTSQAAGQPLRLEVTDGNGRIFLSRPTTGNWQSLDLTAFPPGIFTLRLISKAGAGVQRLVKTGN